MVTEGSRKKLLLAVFIFLLMTACAHTPPIPARPIDFEQGLKVLASNLAEQLENANIGNVINKAVINPIAGQKQLKKIVIDPFIDVESGYPVKANIRIKEIMAAEIGRRFEITGEMEPENLGAAEYVLNGMVTFEGKEEGTPPLYKVNASVFEKKTGKVLASATLRVTGFDTTPMDIYKDSPVFLKGTSYNQHLAAIRKGPNETVDKDYQDRLMIRAMLVKGDRMYEQREFRKSLSYYNQAAGSQADQPMEVLNGQFTNLVKQGQLGSAEVVYDKLARKSISETEEITSKITFGPNSVRPVESKIDQYNIYIRKITKLIASSPACTVKIIGHCSRTGTAQYNDRLSLQRAIWIQNKMASYAPAIMSKTQTIGRGFHENIVGSGRDDITDEIDRRVEFKFSHCGS